MKNNILAAALLALLATVFYSSLAAIVKAQGAAIPLPMLIFIQSGVAFLVFLPIILRRGVTHAKQQLTTQQLGLHILRAICSLAISFALFYSVQYIPLTNAMLLANTAPLLVPFLGFILLSQPINHKLWLPIIIGFAGVALVLRPDGNILQPASFIALSAAFFMALTSLLVRKLVAKDSSETTTLYFLLLSTIISALIAFKFWQPLTSHQWLILILIGVLYACSQYLMTCALNYANARLIAVLYYANIIHSTIISAIFWHTIPTGLTIIGMLLTITGGILCIYAEHLYVNGKQPVTKELSYAKEN